MAFYHLVRRRRHDATDVVLLLAAILCVLLLQFQNLYKILINVLIELM